MRQPSKSLSPVDGPVPGPTPLSLAGDVVAMVVFMTRIPMPVAGEITTARLARAQWALPLVGLGIGAVVAAVLGSAVAIGLPPLVGAFLAVGAGLLLTGALHEDGLADCADGFGGGQKAEEKLAIMRDSRVGTYGAAALLTAIGLKAALFAALATTGWRGLLIVAVAAAVSRGWIPLVMWLSTPVRRDGLGTMAGQPPWQSVAVAAAGAVVLAVAGAWLLPGVIAAPVSLAAAVGVIVLAQYQIGGYTGDVLGACQQTAEIAFLTAAVAAFGL